MNHNQDPTALPGASSLPAAPILYAGLDVAKTSLALDFQGRAEELTNDASGYARLLRRCQRVPVGAAAHVIVEASGGYEQGAVQVLHAAGIAVSVLQPLRVRAFAKAKGLRAKTDPIDAAVLRAFGEAIQPTPTQPPSPPQRRLAELVGRRRQLVASATAESNRSAHYEDALLRRQAAALLRVYRGQIALCEKAIAALLAAETPLQARAVRLQQVPGVGAIVSATLLAEMPELGTLADASAAALAGVAPYNRDSGPYAGTRRIGGGRGPVRTALYMAALSAVRHDPILQGFHQRLLQKGKKPLVALTAVMRKLILLLNRLLKHPTFQLRGLRPTRPCSPKTPGSGAGEAPVISITQPIS